MMSLPFMAGQTYQLIKHYDPELADTYYRFYQEHSVATKPLPDVTAEIRNLNSFFRDMLSQIDTPSLEVRACLDDQETNPQTWLCMFEWEILPLLRRHRFPTITQPFREDAYAVHAQ